MEENNCLILKYSSIIEINCETIEKCFVLDEQYSTLFKLNPIETIEMSYITSGGYDRDYVDAELYFEEPISRKTYDELIRLEMTDDNDELKEELLNK